MQQIFSNCHFQLKENEIDIWVIKIPYNLFENKNDLFIINALKKVLTNDEYQASLKFYKQKDKYRSLSTKFALRLLISYYLNIHYKFVNFEYNLYSKPFISHLINDINLNFNLSHSNEYIIIGFTKNYEIGIDIEFHDLTLDLNSLVPSIFSNHELNEWQSLSASLKTNSFYHVWTCKEAILKAIGIGLSLSPNKITININPNDEPKLINIADCNTVDNLKHFNHLNLKKCIIPEFKNSYSIICAINCNNSVIKYFDFSWDSFLIIQ